MHPLKLAIPSSAAPGHRALVRPTGSGVTRRKQHRPGIAPNANTTHVPTAGSSAALTKPNHTPSRHSRAKGKLLLQTVTPHAAGSRRTHVSRTQECARTHPVNRRATTQYLHTQNFTTRRGCGRNDNQDSPRELPAHRANGTAADQSEPHWVWCDIRIRSLFLFVERSSYSVNCSCLHVNLTSPFF